jgi:hypothetical protein
METTTIPAPAPLHHQRESGLAHGNRDFHAQDSPRLLLLDIDQDEDVAVRRTDRPLLAVWAGVAVFGVVAYAGLFFGARALIHLL